MLKVPITLTVMTLMKRREVVRRVLADGALGERDAGAVHQHMQAAEFLQRERDRGLAVGLRRDVASSRSGRRAPSPASRRLRPAGRRSRPCRRLRAAMRAVAAPRPDAPPVTRNMLFLDLHRMELSRRTVSHDNSTRMQLAFGLRFNDLYERARPAARRRGVPRLPRRRSDARCASKLVAGEATTPLAAKEESDLLVALAPHVEDFIAKLFGIEAEARALAARHNELAPLYSVKRLFVQRRALHKVKPEDATAGRLRISPPSSISHASVTAWLQDEAANAAKLEAAARYAAWATTTPEGKAEAPRRRALQDAAQARLHDASFRCTRRRRAASPSTPRPFAAARRLPAHRPGHRPRRRAGRGELLHLVPRAGQGLLLEGPEGEGARRRASRRRCSACRSPAARSRRRSPSSTW